MLVHLNGKLVPHDQARIGVFDRGFLFGDGVYEGLRAFDGCIVGMDRHITRLRDGLAECRIPWDAGRMSALSDELLEANKLRDAFIYWQITRGAPAPGEPPRARIPTGKMTPTVMGFCYATPPLESHTSPATKQVIAARDARWLRGHVKATSLLGGVLSAIEASEAGMDDAILIRDGLLTEGTSANIFIARDGPGGETRVATPSLESAPILAGITRDLLLEAMPTIEVRAIPARELALASEVMLVGTLTMVTSIVGIDGKAVGQGKPGPAANALLATLVEAIRRDRARQERPALAVRTAASTTK